MNVVYLRQTIFTSNTIDIVDATHGRTNLLVSNDHWQHSAIHNSIRKKTTHIQIEEGSCENGSFGWQKLIHNERKKSVFFSSEKYERFEPLITYIAYVVS